MNIEGKRSGDGFVVHKAALLSALQRAIADRLSLFDVTVGRKGLTNYIRSLGGTVVKMVPATNGASPSAEGQAKGKGIRVVCGNLTSLIAGDSWIGDKTPLSFAEIRVSPRNVVTPNVGSGELADAISRVLPFTAKTDSRPVLNCVKVTAKDGKLTLVAADGFRLAVLALDYEGEGQALIDRNDLVGMASALRKAARVKVSFTAGDVQKRDALVVDTEVTRYTWFAVEGKYPDYEKLIPTENKVTAHLDTTDALKAVRSLKALASNPKDYPVDVTIGNGLVTLTTPDETASVVIAADTDGEGRIRLDGQYFTDAMRSFGGMVDLAVGTPASPALFSSNGHKLVVMPMLVVEKAAEAKAPAAATETAPAAAAEPATNEGEPAAETQTERAPTAEVVAEAEAIAAAAAETQAEPEKPKRRRKAREPVAVA